MFPESFPYSAEVGSQPDSQPLLLAPVFVGECMGVRPLQVWAGPRSLLDTVN